MKVVVTSAGSNGDFNPPLAIAAALARRGVEVTFVANPFYEARVRKAGCRFVGAGGFFDIFAALEASPQYLHSRRALLDIWKKFAEPSIRETYPVVLEAVRDTRATAVVSTALPFGG